MENEQMSFEDLTPQKQDPLYEHAKAAVIDRGTATTGMLQRIFKIGFLRAEGLILRLEREGVISKHIPGKPREVLINKEV